VVWTIHLTENYIYAQYIAERDVKLHRFESVFSFATLRAVWVQLIGKLGMITHVGSILTVPVVESCRWGSKTLYVVHERAQTATRLQRLPTCNAGAVPESSREERSPSLLRCSVKYTKLSLTYYAVTGWSKWPIRSCPHPVCRWDLPPLAGKEFSMGWWALTNL